MTDIKSHPNISAVVLAAGKSERMGNPNKLELNVRGQALIKRTVMILLGSVVSETIVVVGHQDPVIRRLLEDMPVQMVFNENHEQGQMTSVHKGLASIRHPCDGVMICLGDQPLLQSHDINILVSAFANRGNGSIVVPIYEGQRGNPIILAYEHRKAILSGNKNLGCKRLVERNPDLVCTVEMETDHVIVDMDTPEDYAAVQARQ